MLSPIVLGASRGRAWQVLLDSGVEHRVLVTPNNKAQRESPEEKLFIHLKCLIFQKKNGRRKRNFLAAVPKASGSTIAGFFFLDVWQTYPVMTHTHHNVAQMKIETQQRVTAGCSPFSLSIAEIISPPALCEINYLNSLLLKK